MYICIYIYILHTENNIYNNNYIDLNINLYELTL